MQSLLFLLLPVAFLAGWAVGRNDLLKRQTPTLKKLPSNYFEGLHFLLNDQPDKAVDRFIKVLEVDSDTVETHLALGKLFRHKGEVDRAIRVHQNIIARPDLDKEQRVQSLLELAHDYMRAGVLDRAEKLFLRLIEMGEHQEASLQQLIDVYHQEKDWHRAIRMSEKLAAVRNVSMKTPIAHYYCELSEQAWGNGDVSEAEHFLNRAIHTNKNCVRAYILFGHYAYYAGEYKNALRYFLKVTGRKIFYLSEVITMLASCYEKLGKVGEFEAFFADSLQAYPELLTIMLHQGSLSQLTFPAPLQSLIDENLKEHPSVLGVCYLHKSDLFEKLLAQVKEKAIYRCHQCGVVSKKLYWHCPSCKLWDAARPIKRALSELTV